MDLLTYRPINPRLKSAKLAVLVSVIVAAVMTLPPVAYIAQEDTTTQENKEKGKVAPERLLFISYGTLEKSFQGPMGVFFDSNQDEILVADTGNNRVVILDGTDGYPKSEFTISGEPRNLAVNSMGEILIVSNSANYVEVRDFRGSHLAKIQIENYMLLPVKDPAQYANARLKPVAVTVDSEDNIYVATTRWIFIFDRDFEFLRQVGSVEQGPATFDSIADIWVDADGKIFVVSMQGTAVNVLSP
ncbi:NHL repeat-containing protein, partial [Candidatus Poribacteria bacterium]